MFTPERAAHCCLRWLSVCLFHLGHLDIDMSLQGLWAEAVFGLILSYLPW